MSRDLASWMNVLVKPCVRVMVSHSNAGIKGAVSYTQIIEPDVSGANLR